MKTEVFIALCTGSQGGIDKCSEDKSCKYCIHTGNPILSCLGTSGRVIAKQLLGTQLTGRQPLESPWVTPKSHIHPLPLEKGAPPTVGLLDSPLDLAGGDSSSPVLDCPG